MSARDIAGSDADVARSGDRAGVSPLLGRKAALLGLLTSGFVVANAAQLSTATAGTVKPIAASLPAYAYVSRWTPSTAYALGQQIISPYNDVVAAKVAHTSSAAYVTDQLKWTLSSTYARGGSQPFGQGGAATVGSSGAWMAPFTLIVTRVVLSCIGAPVGSPLVVAFKHDSATFATCTIPAGTKTTVSAVATEPVANLGALWVTATSVGSITAATDIVAQIDWIKY